MVCYEIVGRSFLVLLLLILLSLSTGILRGLPTTDNSHTQTTIKGPRNLLPPRDFFNSGNYMYTYIHMEVVLFST